MLTSDDVVRALDYRQRELQLLNDAIGRALTVAMGANKRLDAPDVAYLQLVRANLDLAIEQVSTALIHAREPAVAAYLLAGEDTKQPQDERNPEPPPPATEPVADDWPARLYAQWHALAHAIKDSLHQSKDPPLA